MILDQRYVSNSLSFFLIFSTALIILFPYVASASWTIEEVDAPKWFNNFYQRTIAIEKTTNNPHIVYGGDHLYHAYFEGIDWQYETVDSSPGAGGFASIAIDSDNKVHVSYCDTVNKTLKYATNVSGAWEIYVIDNSGKVD